MMPVTLTVLKNLYRDKLFHLFLRAEEDGNSFNDFLGALYESGAEESFYGYVSRLILHDENAFSMRCAGGQSPSDFVVNAYQSDLETVFALLENAQTRGCYRMHFSPAPPFDRDAAASCRNLAQFYAANAYGDFIENTAFLYVNGALVPVKNAPKTLLSELKDYRAEKEQIRANLANFLDGLPFCHMLLYGDRGTGKSSTVHAMAAAFRSKGLRVIELRKENFDALAPILQKASALPLKFIVFADDLSFDGGDACAAQLKACMEGSFSAIPPNVMLVATSNRRHLVRESFAERQDAVHANDTVQEQLSLADRFGLTVLFSSTDRAAYLSIVRQLAADRSLKTQGSSLDALAERWAIAAGGRSPRRARQFVDALYACELRGVPLDF